MDYKKDPLREEEKINADLKATSVSNSVDIVEAQGFDEKATKNLIRRLDWHLIPFLSLIYL